MRPHFQKTIWLTVLIVLTTVSQGTARAQDQDKDKPPAKPGEGEIKQGDQMGGRVGMS